MKETPIYVIFWGFTDGSCGGVIRAYTNREEADQMMQFLEEYGDTTRNFRLAEVPLVTQV